MRTKNDSVFCDYIARAARGRRAKLNVLNKR